MTLGKEIAFILFFNHSLIYFAGFSLLPGGFLQFRRAGPARQRVLKLLVTVASPVAEHSL